MNTQPGTDHDGKKRKPEVLRCRGGGIQVRCKIQGSFECWKMMKKRHKEKGDANY